MAHDDDMGALLFNLLTGAPLDGLARSNASWLHRGSIGYIVNDKPARRWHYLTRAERMAIRWVCTVAVAAVAWSYFMVDRDQTVRVGQVVGWVAGAVGLLGLGWWVCDRLLLWPHRSRWVWPLHTALHELLGYSEWTRPWHYIGIPLDFDRGGRTPGSILLPADFVGSELEDEGGGRSAYGYGQGAQRKGTLVRQVLTEKLPLSDKQLKWHMKGREHWLEILPVPRPPERVDIAHPAVRALVMGQADTKPLLGLKALPLGASRQSVGELAWEAGGVPVDIDLETETPHVGIFMRSGLGKSVLASSLLAQWLNRGRWVVIIDHKMVSHKWARLHPGVIYVSHPQDIHNVLLLLAAEAEIRKQIVAAWDSDDEEPPVGPGIMVCFEELNATFRKLARFWTRTKTSKDQKDSPAVEAYEDGIFEGRALAMHWLLIGQAGTTRHIGGPEVRENLHGGLILGGWSPNAWRMLASGVPGRMPQPSRKPGRVQLVRAAHATEIQGTYFSDPKYGTHESWLWKWATGGIESPPLMMRDILASIDQPLRSKEQALELLPAPALLGSVTGSQVSQAPYDMGDGPVTVTTRRLVPVPSTPEPAESAEPVDELITLEDAFNDGIVNAPSLGALRQRRQRHRDRGTFPDTKRTEGQKEYYSRNELAFWDRQFNKATHDQDGETA